MSKESKGIASVSRRKFVGGAATGAAALGLGMLGTRPARAQERYVVRISASYPDNPLVPDMKNEFAELLREHSKGQFDVKVFPGSVLGSSLENAQQLQNGSLEIANMSSSNFAAFVPFYNALDFPYVTRGYEGPLTGAYNGLKIVNSQVFRDAAENAALEKGFVLGFWTPMGMRMLILRKQIEDLVSAPADVKGLKVRVTGSLVERKAFEILGANPAPISWPETFTSLQKGVIDGFQNDMIGAYSSQFGQIAGSITRTNFYPVMNLFIASRMWLEKLPTHLQEAFRSASDEAAEMQIAKLEASTETATEELKKQGVKIVEPSAEDYEKWVAAIGYENPIWEPTIKELVGDVDTFHRLIAG